jgi:hypothetical protein
VQITITLLSDLEQDLIRQAVQANVPLQTFVLQILCQLIQSKSGSIFWWSEVVLSYKGSPDFPAFESYRDEFLPFSKPELF